MQLDQTRIAIRERSYPELLDLALVVGRQHLVPLIGWWAVGVAPWALLDYLYLVVWDQGFSADDLIEPQTVAGYLMAMTLLIVWQIPLATAPLTLYLGQILFEARPSRKRLLRDWLSSLGQLLWFQGLLRLLFILPVITWILPYSVWPYLNEVLLLERNPLWSTRATGTTTWRRSLKLHSRSSGELFARWLGGTLLGVGASLGVWLLLWVLTHLLLESDWEADPSAFTVIFPLSVWIVVGFMAVARFLCYLDLRTRHEGWELELRVRAEAARLERRWA